MLLRNILDDMNGLSVSQAKQILDVLCIDKTGEYAWNFVVDCRDNMENTSILLVDGKFVADTFIHKNYAVQLDIDRAVEKIEEELKEELQEGEPTQDEFEEAMKGFAGFLESMNPHKDEDRQDIQRIELAIKISIEFPQLNGN